MIEIFQGWMQDFFKVFVDVLNIHKCSWQEHVKHMNLSICTSQGVGGGGFLCLLFESGRDIVHL
jgi:hypothetical protein